MVEPLDLACVRGQETAKRALEIAAAGGHPLLLKGPARTGKSLLARCFAGILPTPAEERVLLPCRTTGRDMEAAFGLRDAVVLFEELPRLAPTALAAFRVAAARKSPSVLLIATMRPCPCGRHQDQAEGCLCTSRELKSYASRLAAVEHLFHLRVVLGTVTRSDLLRSPGEPSEHVAGRVASARRHQEERGGLNATREAPALGACADPELSSALIGRARVALQLVEEQVLRVARTIADLDGKEQIEISHLAEAIHYGRRIFYSTSSIKA